MNSVRGPQDPHELLYIQGAYDAECAPLARALETVAEQTTPEKVTIFTDAQAATKRMASEDPGPGPGRTAHRDAAERSAGHRHRDPIVPSPQESSGKRECRRIGEARGRGA